MTLETSNNQKKNEIVLSDTFLDSVAKLDASTAKRALGLVGKLKKNASSRGLKLEKLSGDMSPFLSARIDDGNRLILLNPEDNIFVFVWADSHDEAYDWASRHVCRLNERQGNIQIYEVEKTTIPPVPKEIVIATESSPPPVSRLFDKYTDDQLTAIGIPLDRLAKIRELKTRSDLDDAIKFLPEAEYENLVSLADGTDIQEILLETKPPKPIKSWKEALKKPQRSVKVWKDEDLLTILLQPIERWRVFLHPEQQKLVQNPKHYPMMVRGSAGTGKTVVAMHRAAHLVKDPNWDPSKKILFTTYTVNLAVDIAQNLKGLCSLDEAKRIEVVNLDKWVGDFLKRKNIKQRIVYPSQKDGIYERCWNNALLAQPQGTRFSEEFLLEEWQNVILPNRVLNEADYLKASRKGRGKAILRKDRKDIWPVFEEMRSTLSQNNAMTFEDACFIANDILISEPTFRPYDTVIVDEAQDIGAEGLQLLATIATPAVLSEDKATNEKAAEAIRQEPRIFLAGDGQQRIYAKKASLTGCGINVKGGRSKRLKVTYRTTDEIRKSAEVVLEGNDFDDSDEGIESRKGSLSFRKGSYPQVKQLPDREQEVKWIDSKIKELRMGENPIEYGSICIVARTNSELNLYQKELERLHYKPVKVARNKPDDRTKAGIRLATMHRVKGLEFKAVFIVGAGNGLIPLPTAVKAEDPIVEKREKLQERSLFYVAASRARDNLFISSYGPEGEYMKQLETFINKTNKGSKLSSTPQSCKIA